MPSLPKPAGALEGARRLIADETLTIAIFSAVMATSVLAFGFGAPAEIVISMLVVGAATAFSEIRLRARK